MTQKLPKIKKPGSNHRIIFKISQNPQNNNCAWVSFLMNLLALASKFIKKRLWYMCFPVNFAKFLKTPF